jgi:hypothetical protein
VLCVFGNDVSHIDSKRGQTTAGTPMDVDTRYIRVYRRICEVHRRAVDRLRDVAPVDIKIVSGNHDELTSVPPGRDPRDALRRRVRHVTVDNSRGSGSTTSSANLFGFTHGDAEKVSELPLVMAREIPERGRAARRANGTSDTSTSPRSSLVAREQDLFSDKGVRVRRLASLSAHDAWHTKHAYMDRRACDASSSIATPGSPITCRSTSTTSPERR